MKTGHIVLIEDNPGDVRLVKMALEEGGVSHEVRVFPRGADALLTLSAPNADLPDAILLDLNTPQTDGFEAYLKLRELPRLARVPIAILTSSRAGADKHRAAILGARYVEKPSQLQEFLTTVSRLAKELLEPPASKKSVSLS